MSTAKIANSNQRLLVLGLQKYKRPEKKSLERVNGVCVGRRYRKAFKTSLSQSSHITPTSYYPFNISVKNGFFGYKMEKLHSLF